MRLVGPNGEQVGIVRVEDALRLAAEADLDLVEVAPMARPPVAKLMDFGKYKYEAAMKAREARKNQVNTVIKEIKLRPKIDPHDYGTKKGHVERFLKAGDKVKVTIMFRGREQSRPELGYRLLQRLAEDIGELGFVESSPKQDGRNMIMVIGPTKKKSEAKAEARRAREAATGPGERDRRPADPRDEAQVGADDAASFDDVSFEDAAGSSGSSDVADSGADQVTESREATGLEGAASAASEASQEPAATVDGAAPETAPSELDRSELDQSGPDQSELDQSGPDQSEPDPSDNAEPAADQPEPIAAAAPSARPATPRPSVPAARPTPGPARPTSAGSSGGSDSAARPAVTPRPAATPRPTAAPKPGAAPKPSATPKPAPRPRPAQPGSSAPKPTPRPGPRPTAG